MANEEDRDLPASEYVGGDWWWRVSGPYVTVKTSTTEGTRIIGLHTGGVLPLDVAAEQVKHLADHGLIEKFPITKAQSRALADDPPGGTPGARGLTDEERQAMRDAERAAEQEAVKRPTQGATHQRASTSAKEDGGSSGHAASGKASGGKASG